MHQIVKFARDTLGVTLYDGQASALTEYYESDKQNWLLLAGRRSGKSLLSDIIACYEALIPSFSNMTRQDEERYILLISVRQDSAQLHIRNIAKLLKHNKKIGALIEKVSEDRIILNTGVVILSLPASARAARGYTASTLVFDEAAFYVDTNGNSSAEAIYTALEPTTATFGEMARIVITTSVGAKTGLVFDLYDRAISGELENYFITKVPTTEMNPKVSQKTINAALKRDPEAGAAEYLAEFRERSEAFFSSEMIDRCIDRSFKFPAFKKRDHDTVIMAIDPALLRDRYAYAVGHFQDGTIIIDYVKALKPPVDPNEAEALISVLNDKYKPTKILCDNASTVQRLQPKIKAMTYAPFTRPMKLKIYGSLKESINLETIILPNDSELIDELKSLQIRNGNDIAAPKSGRVTHDDLADCVALVTDGLLDAKNHKVTMTVIKDPFGVWPWPDGHDYTQEFGIQPKGKINKQPHPEGVTFENCRYRQNGCLACLEEQKPFIEQEEQELKRGVQSGNYLAWEAHQQEISDLATIQSEKNAKQAQLVNLFWTNVSNYRSN